MSEPAPRLRLVMTRAEGERLLAREVVRIVFYLPHDHRDMAANIERALGHYRHAVGEELALGCDESDDLFPLTSEGWGSVYDSLRRTRSYRFVEELEEDSIGFRYMAKTQLQVCLSLMGGSLSYSNGYELNYRARAPWRDPPVGSVSVLSATLPTECLEERGPGFVRELAMSMAAELPLASGHAGFSLAMMTPQSNVLPCVQDELMRHPGLDVPSVDAIQSSETQLDGVHWLNFLGPTLLQAVGGRAGLRARLHSPDTTVLDVGSSGAAVVSLGARPEAGDLVTEDVLPAYRELAHVLEPWLEPFHPRHALLWRGFGEVEVRRWWRRFLD